MSEAGLAQSELARLGYAHYYQMLSDQVRMTAYHQAIRKTVRPGDVVVDLGAGTGILGLWALQAGAEKVYAIEKTDAVHLARELARANHCEDKIEFIQANSIDVELPEKADVLISETLGSFGVDENTLAFTRDAVTRFLKADARIIPQALELYVAPLDDAGVYHKLDFWRQIPELDFSPAFELFSRKIMIESVKPQGLLAPATNVGQLDLTNLADTEYQARVYMQMTKPGILHGVAGWFHCRLCEGININTAPDQPETHWKQAFFPFRDPIEVIAGDVLDWSVLIGAKGTNSDDTLIRYDYRCTQLKNEAPKNESGNAAVKRAPGRNDPCPCGSGRKYKKCCL